MARAPYFRLPILVPRSPVQHGLPPLVRQPPRNDTALWIFGFLLLSLEVFRRPAARKIARKSITSGFSGLASRTKPDKLLYMWDGGGSSKPVSVPRGKIKARQKAAKAGRGKLYALYARTADEARSVIARGGAKEAQELEGDLVNCALWQETYSPKSDKPVFRCLMYAPACDPTTVARPPSPGKSGKKCISFQKLYSPSSKKKITRCKKYGMVKTGASCLPEPMPRPDREMYVPSRKEIKALAKSMSEEKNALEAESGPWVAREIMSRGGIAPYRGKYLAEEYREIPLHLKNKKGLPLDQMADEMNTDEGSLVEQIAKAYPKGEKKKRRFAASDFEKEAEVFLYRQHEQFGGIGDDLFVNLRREAALTTDDPATSDDLFVACMERRGWKPARMRNIQDSIAEKMTPDLFTGKKGKLTGGEAQYQDEVDRCLAQMTRQRKSGKPKSGQMRMFGTLAGMVSCCAKWKKVGVNEEGKPVYRCFEYLPTCSPPADSCLKTKALKPGEDLKAKEKAAKKKAKPAAGKTNGKRLSQAEIKRVLAFDHKRDSYKYSDFIKRGGKWYGVLEKALPNGQIEIMIATDNILFIPLGRVVLEKRKLYDREYLTKISRETEKAIQIETARKVVPSSPETKGKGSEKVVLEEWLPKSQIMNVGNDLIFVPEWLVRDKTIRFEALLRLEDIEE